MRYCGLMFITAVLSVPVAAEDSVPKYDLRCGSYTLYVSLRALDLPVSSFEELERKLGQPSQLGYSMGELAEAGRSYGAHALGVETTAENLQQRPGRFACIALIDEAHFVVVADIDDGQVSVIDPPRSANIPLETFRTQWDGRALLISRDPLLPEEELPRPIRWSILWLALGVIGVALTGWFLSKKLRTRTG